MLFIFVFAPSKTNRFSTHATRQAFCNIKQKYRWILKLRRRRKLYMFRSVRVLTILYFFFNICRHLIPSVEPTYSRSSIVPIDGWYLTIWLQIVDLFLFEIVEMTFIEYFWLIDATIAVHRELFNKFTNRFHRHTVYLVFVDPLIMNIWLSKSSAFRFTKIFTACVHSMS